MHPPPRQGRKVRINPLSRYHLVSPFPYSNGLMGANTPKLCNGSTRRQLLAFSGMFHCRGYLLAALLSGLYRPPDAAR